MPLQQVSPHIYWMPPAPPDRPSLCAVCGTHATLMLDAGASVAHTQAFLAGLQAAGQPMPQHTLLTHWHWDHVFGAVAIDGELIAHRQTAQQLAVMAGWAWDDDALDARVITGEEIIACANDIKQELPSPRTVTIRQPDRLFEESLTLDLGGVTAEAVHVGGDHAPDAVVIYIPQDRLLFLGDCLYEAVYTPVRHFTVAQTLPLIARIEAFDADFYIEGHSDSVMTRADMQQLLAQLRQAGELCERHQGHLQAMRAEAVAQGLTLDEDFSDFLEKFANGVGLAK